MKQVTQTLILDSILGPIFVLLLFEALPGAICSASFWKLAIPKEFAAS